MFKCNYERAFDIDWSLLGKIKIYEFSGNKAIFCANDINWMVPLNNVASDMF